MMVSGHQPNLLPYLGFWHKMAECDLFVLADDVQFQVKEWANRNRIIVNGAPHLFTWPVKRGGLSTKRYNEVMYTDDDWLNRFTDTLMVNYPSKDSRELVEELAKQVGGKRNLTEVNVALIEWLRALLDIHTKTLFRSTLDLRINDASSMLVEECLKLDADRYLSGPGGSSYINTKAFADANIVVIWQDFKHPLYRQRSRVFYPNMSVIDYVLCNPGRTFRDCMRGSRLGYKILA